MSGIAGIYRRQSDLNPELLDSIISTMAHRGPDGRKTWTEGTIALGACLLKTTPESENETPISSVQTGRYQLIWDGRIDNREEILPQLDSGLANAPDPIIFIHAYQLWGRECLSRLIGEFAFALWDRTEQRLFAGRDRVGLKPFHYAWDGSDFYFSSEIKPLLKIIGGEPEFNDEMILSFLSFRNFKEEDHGRTFFKKIQRLAPAHCLILKDGVLRVERYASWNLSHILHYKDPNDYVEHFKEIFEKAVKARLRSRTRTTALLSGGHDSSAIVSMASMIMKKKEVSCPELEAINFYSDDPLTDERSYAREVAQKAGIRLDCLFAKTTDFITGLGDFLYQVEAPMINTSRNLEPYEFLQGRGVRAVLTGEGGDQILDEFGFGADLLAHFRFSEFIRKSKTFSEEFNDNPLEFMKESILQIIPEKFLNLRRSIVGSVPARWLNKSFIREKKFKSRVLRSESRPRFQSFSQAATYFEVTRPYGVMKLELDERAWAKYGIELRCPFYDSRVIQFILSLPWELRASGTRKLILKQAMKGLTPEIVLARRDKANHTAQTDLALQTLLARQNPEVLCNRSGVMNQYVDFSRVRKLSDRYLAGQKDLRFELWFLITVDYLLQQFTQGALYDRKKDPKKEIQLTATY